MGLIADFKKFAMRGNLIDLAIGFTVGAAFTTIARSLVDDILMPPVGLLLGSADFSDLFLVLDQGTEAAPPYTTLAEAQAAGAVTINYGIFITNLLAFLMVTLMMFLIIRGVNRFDEALNQEFAEEKPQPDDPPNKKCPFCLTLIPFKAVRCPACTTRLKSTKPG